MDISHLPPDLSLICDRSFAAGLVPSDWKIADIVPIFKKGAKDDPTNQSHKRRYRVKSWNR